MNVNSVPVSEDMPIDGVVNRLSNTSNAFNLYTNFGVVIDRLPEKATSNHIIYIVIQYVFSHQELRANDDLRDLGLPDF